MDSDKGVVDEHARAEERHRIALRLGIPADFEHRIIKWPLARPFFSIKAIHDPVNDIWHTEFVGTRVKFVGVLHDTPPGTDGPKMALFRRETQRILRRDPQTFDPAMLVEPTLEIWYAEVYPPDSDLGIVIRWSPQTGKLLSVPETPMGTIRGEDLDKAKLAFDLFLTDLSLRKPAHRPSGTRNYTREEFRERYAAE